MSEDTPTARACTKCGETKLLVIEFAQAKRGKYGRDSWCRACRAEASRAWYIRKRRTDRDFLDQRKERRYRATQDWRLRNGDAVREYERKYRAENAERVAERERAYRLANPERVREKNRARRARLLSAMVAPVDLELIWARDEGTCRICFSPIDRELKWPHRFSLTLDHIIPLAKGGTHEPRNVRLAHAVCNSRKGDRLP